MEGYAGAAADCRHAGLAAASVPDHVLAHGRRVFRLGLA
jgi:hypothetical protein